MGKNRLEKYMRESYDAVEKTGLNNDKRMGTGC